jgi:DNA-binding transcriptional regulator LsrR (DeoR family)
MIADSTSRTIDPTARRIRLAEAATRYYLDGWSQDEVARHLGTSRSNVSRLLETARREGIVRFVVDHPLRRHDELEARLLERFDLQETLVAVSGDDPLDRVGRLAAGWLTARSLSGKRVAIGWGRTIEATIEHVVVPSPTDVEIVQVGGDLTMAPAASGHELVRRLAGALGGRHRFLHAPAVVETEALARDLLADPRIAHELGLAKTADLALIGIGLPGRGFAERTLADAYRGTEPPAAVVVARLVDDRGRELPGPHADRVIALTLDELRAVDTVVGVAAGAEKGRAVAAAARGGLVDVLVCDQEAASAALATTHTQED